MVVLAGGGAAWMYLVRPARQQAAAAVYADPAACGGCHAGIAETYRRTGMGRSFYLPATANTIGDAKKEVSYYHRASDSYFTMQERDGRIYQGRYQIGFDGKKTNLIEKPVDYVLGSGNHVRAYLSRTKRNTLVELPLAWYAEKGGYWAMNPAYDRPDHPGFRRTITDGCMFCHNAIPQVDRASGDDPVFPADMPNGIDCQRCHGPGSEHVQKAEGGAKTEEIRKAIVNPARLSAERQMEVCMQCHLETTSFRLPNAFVRYERGPYSYRPGEPLADFMLHFDEAPGKDRDEKFQIASAAYRLRRSECFRKSAGKLGCTTCHNPHDIPRGGQAAAHYTAVCRQCHSAQFDQLVASGKHSRSGDCLGCHMPKRRTDDVVHAVMTDHYIQRRTPDRDLLAEVVERRETEENSYRGEVLLYYPPALPKSPENGLYLAIAQVSQGSNLGGGIPLLKSAIEKYRPERAEPYLHLADALSRSGRPQEAIPMYEEALLRKPDFPVALERYAEILRSSGQLARAAETLKKALALAPGSAANWHQLGLVYLAQGSRPDALDAFQKAVSFDDGLAEARNSLGGIWFEGGDLARAEKEFREALRIQPDYAEARSNLGNVLSAGGRFPEAQFQFEGALRLKPNYSAARFNYALALAKLRRLDDSQRQIEQLLRMDPAMPEAHDLLGNLMAAKGRAPAALEQYREAVRLRPDYGRALLDLGELLADMGDAATAVPILRKAAQSPQQQVRKEAVQTLRQLGKQP
jgi:predicted CXXCH cytochrome family protein